MGTPAEPKTENPVVLIVEDNEDWTKYLTAAVPAGTETLCAATLAKASELFAERRSDIVLIIMDGCVPGNDLNTVPLIRDIRKTYTGNMIAASSYGPYLMEMLTAGCNLQYPKHDIPGVVSKLLHESAER